MDPLFALYDSDVFYATRFMEYFKKKNEFIFTIATFTKIEALTEFIKTNSIEILLIHEELSMEGIPMDRVKYVYKLTETLSKEVSSDHLTVFKYQAAQSLMKEILHDYSLKVNALQTANRTKKVKVITINPLRPEVEALAYTWSIATMLAEQRKVLLIMLDPLPTPIFTSLYNKDNNLTEFIYYLKGASSIPLHITNLSYESNHLSILSGLAHGSDILFINKEDIQKWVEELRSSIDYQAVIFYLSGYTEAGNELMRISDIITIPLKNHPYNKELYRVFCDQLRTTGLEMHNKGVHELQLPEELNLGQTPITIQELMGTKAWNLAKQTINTYL